jgi:glycosyltransferase involved in cell wall biosynthesis
VPRDETLPLEYAWAGAIPERERPHVVHVVEYLTESALTFLLCAIRALDDIGCRQTLTFARNAEATPGLVRRIPSSVGLIELPDGSRARLDYARGLFRILLELAAQPPQLTVHLHAVRCGIVERVVLARLHGRAACFYTPHAAPLLDPYRPLARASNWVVERIAGRLPIAPVCRSVAEARLLARAWRRAAHTLETPVDDCYFDVVPRPSRLPVIIGVGRAVGRNAPELFAQLALRFEIDERAACFVWVGDGDRRQEKRLRACGVQLRRCAMTCDLAHLLAGAAVYVQTSVWEGAPLSLMRAMAVGLPCVVTDVGGHRDLVVHGRTGLVARNFDELDRHVRGLLDAPELRHRLGGAARRLAFRRFGRERFAAALQRLYGLGPERDAGRVRHRP